MINDFRKMKTAAKVVNTGILIADEDGAQAAAKYLFEREIPFDVAYRVILNPSKRRRV